MKRQSRIMRLGVLALTLTMITTCLTGGTLARYVSEVTGTATASVAAWSFKANDQDTAMTAIDLGSTANRTAYNTADIAAGVIAPGTTGKFDIVLDGTGSEVGVDYVMKFAAAAGTNLPADLTFKVGETAYSLGSDVSGTIDYSPDKDAMKKTLAVTWEWPFDENDAKDNNDNTYADKDWTLNITVTGKQTIPETTAAP